MRRNRPSGFTLIEVMIVVAIIGILAAIGYPSYREHLVRGQLVDATNGLAAMRAETERYYQDNRTYGNTGTFKTPCDSASTSVKKYGGFDLACDTTADAQSYRIKATSTVPAVQDFKFTIDQAGVQATVSAASGWNTCANYWLIKKGQTCPSS